jgi:hypothetical protein
MKEDIVDHFRDQVEYPLYKLEMNITEELSDIP